MSSSFDKWGGPAWAFQSKIDAVYDLLGATFDASNNLDLPGTLDVTGAATLDSTLGVTGEATLTGGATFGATQVVRKSATVTVSASELNNMKATPVEIVADPAAGTLLLPIYAMLSYNAGTTGFTCAAGDEDIVIQHSGASAAFVTVLCDNNTGGIDFTGTTDKRVYVPAVFPADTAAAAQLPEAEGFILQHDGTGEWADGDGTLDVTIVYDEYTW